MHVPGPDHPGAGMKRPFPRARSRLRADAGFGLVDAMVALVLLLMIGFAAYATYDRATASSANIKTRAVAASVAQEDQERLRSLTVDQLSNRHETRQVSLGGLEYDVRSDVTWITSATTTASCSGAARATNYLEITSTASSNGMVHPIVLKSFVAPTVGGLPGRGALNVQVSDRAGAGQAAVNATATGPDTASETTNAAGCIFFPYLTAGAYTLDFDQGGYVDRDGNQHLQHSINVAEGRTSTDSLVYDLAGSVSVSFDTQIGGGAAQPARADQVTVANSGLSAPGTRIFGADGTPADTVTADALFPFTDPYALYAGGCPGADPRAYGQSAAVWTVMPGQAASATVRVPALNLLVTSGGAPVAGARVRAEATATGCSAVVELLTGASGALTAPALPYGTYDLCAEAGGMALAVTDVRNDDPAGTPVLGLALDTGSPGACPP